MICHVLEDEWNQWLRETHSSHDRGMKNAVVLGAVT